MRRSDLTTEKRENVLMGPSEVSSVFPNEPFQLGVLGALAVSNFGLGLTARPSRSGLFVLRLGRKLGDHGSNRRPRPGLGVPVRLIPRFDLEFLRVWH